MVLLEKQNPKKKMEVEKSEKKEQQKNRLALFRVNLLFVSAGCLALFRVSLLIEGRH